MSNQSWWLANAEELHATAPRSFFIPPREHRENLQVGRVAKLAFEFEPRELQGVARSGERMWVVVSERRDNGSYIGQLDNAPDLLTELKPGDAIEFGAEHVIAIHYSPDELGYDPHAFANIDTRVVTDDLPPDIVVFARPPGAPEHIWFASIGHDAPEQTRFITLGELTDRWPHLANVFSSAGGGWERVAGESTWRQVAAPDAG